ncbi:hypothetical protein OG933_45450 (plasmid) [Streptomyces sp. NBC_00016]|uniref:hypothetical protein n=1 Tax=Streptomyces sp. NBC_00016 TaxID=2975622 RepID=UPI002F90A1BA
MTDLLQHAVRLMLNGLLTQLPAQLLTTAVAAAAAAGWRARRRRRVTLAAKPVPPANEQ